MTRRWYLWRPQAMEIMRGPDVPAASHDDVFAHGVGAFIPRGNAAFELTGLPVAAVEHLVQLLLLPPTLLARALGLLPWTVVARPEEGPRREWSVRGSAEAKRRLAEVVHTIEQGQPWDDIASAPRG